MRILVVIAVGFNLTQQCSAEDFAPFEGSPPIAIFIQSNPWAMVIGSDTPRVAIYENGQVIFAKTVNKRLTYHHVTLDKEELSAVRKQIKSVLELKTLKRRYNIRPNVTDQSEAMFYLRDGDRELATSVYGLMPGGIRTPATQFANGPKPTVPPDEVFKLHKWFFGIDYPNSHEWTPKYIEVMLWDYSHAPGDSIQWPKEWPSLNSDRAIKRGDAYSIFLDGSLRAKLREFLLTRKPSGAVEIEGKKMSVSCRLTFPGEPVWRRAFAGESVQETTQNNRGETGGLEPFPNLVPFGTQPIDPFTLRLQLLRGLDGDASTHSPGGGRVRRGSR